MTTPPVIIVGGGPAGLATAACLKQRGVDSIVLDKGEAVGQSWRDRYERLHLHTPRIQSHLPGFRIPREAGQWVSKDRFADYLVDYADHFGIEPRHGVTVARIERAGDEWVVLTSEDELRSKVVVMATGYNGTPIVPAWPGREDFPSELVHASDYSDATPYVDRDVLVVGTGNTGAEIAADLAESGARTVWLSVRTPPNIVPRSLGGVPISIIGIGNEYTPPAIGDPLTLGATKALYRDLREHGMPMPEMGAISQHREHDRIPIIDVGLVEQLRAGRVTPVAAVEAFDGAEVVLADGERISPDAVIAATGYRTGLPGLVGHLGILDDKGRPMHHRHHTHPDAPGMYFVGLSNRFIGLLNTIRIDAKKTAEAIARELA
ncbi:MAG: NAD(P)/FAD-dependent oxidoreductase [Nitriliruptorales bacterium]|nr:NAD(P)/FAD-dependent oxidoreductase [Nitriliruptorales bacterium]